MLEFIQHLFSQEFMPHGHCLFWRPEIIRLYVIGDGLTAIAYYSIPVAPNGQFLRMNNLFHDIFGYSEDEMLKLTFQDITHSDELEIDTNLSNQLLAGKIKAYSMEKRYLRKEGAIIWVNLTISLVHKPDGKPKYFICVAEDITKQKQMQEKLVISYKMASLGRLTAGIFHEVLNPLHIISSHVQLLLMEAEKGSKTEEDLKSIQEEIGRIVTISDGLSRLSRKEKLPAEDVEINDLLEKVIIVVEPDMKLSSIRFIRKFEDGLPEIMANSDGLRQVFLNLITNARDAMPDGGTLTVKTRRVLSSEIGVKSEIEKDSLPVRQAGELEGDFIGITFEDTGFGISKDDIDKIFEPFFTTKQVGKGTGLGLSISYGVIKNHGGTISVESEEGKGTIFIIDLPC